MDIDEKEIKLKKRGRFFPILLFLFIPLFLVSCNSTIDNSKTLSTLPGEDETRNVVSVTPLQESTFISTRQFSTAEPSLPTIPSSKTQTHVPALTKPVTATLYPIQNLSDIEKLEIMDLLNNKDDCELPCWNGITPGVSHLEEMQGFFARLGYDIGPWPPQEDENEGHMEVKVEGFPPGSLSYSYFYISLQWENRVVNRIEIDLWGHPEQFSMNRIIKQLGNPTSIRIIHGVGGKIPVYAIGLLYEEINLVLEIRGNLMASNNIDFPYQVCLTNKKEQYIKAIMYSDPANFEIEKEYYMDPWEDWAKVIGMSTDDLIQGLLDPNECIFYP